MLIAVVERHFRTFDTLSIFCRDIFPHTMDQICRDTLLSEYTLIVRLFKYYPLSWEFTHSQLTMFVVTQDLAAVLQSLGMFHMTFALTLQ